MKTISLKISDAEYQALEMMRGNSTKSDYIRMLISARHEGVKREIGDLQQLITDVNIIKCNLLAGSESTVSKEALLALAEYLKDVMTIANPPAYANYRDKLQQYFQTLKMNISGEG